MPAPKRFAHIHVCTCTYMPYKDGSRNWVRRPGGKKLRSISWGTYQNVRVGQIASVEGAKLRLPRRRQEALHN